MIRAWGPILPGWRRLYALRPISDQRDWGFHVVRGRGDPGDTCFHPQGVGVVVIRRGVLNGGWSPILPGLRSLYALPAVQRPARGIGVREAVSTRKNLVFVPGVSELDIYERISEPGMGTNPPRVRREWGVRPRGNSRRARLAFSSPSD